MISAEILAILAALCYAINSVISASVREKVDVLTFTLLQVGIGAVMTGTLALALGGWATIRPEHLLPLALSGAFGVLVTALSLTGSIFILGARLPAVLFCLNTPFAVILGYVFLGEALTAMQLVGAAIVVAGIVIAVLFGAERRSSGAAPSSALAAVNLPASGVHAAAGVALSVLAALGQAVGSLFARPAMAAMADPFAATSVRTATAVLLLAAYAMLRRGALMRFSASPGPVLFAAASKAFFGVVLGMSLLLAALSRGDVGLVSTLSSLAPVLVLPLIWIAARKAPRWEAWVGALVAVAGAGLVMGG